MTHPETSMLRSPMAIIVILAFGLLVGAQAIHAQLREAGVREIEDANLCTACNIHDFYSARAENRMNGCFGSAIALSA